MKKLTLDEYLRRKHTLETYLDSYYSALKSTSGTHKETLFSSLRKTTQALNTLKDTYPEHEL